MEQTSDFWSKNHFWSKALRQTAWILDNFEVVVKKKQLLRSGEEKSNRVVITPVGSFLNDKEFPLEYREKFLSMLDKFSRENNVLFYLYIETFPSDITNAEKNGNLRDVSLYLQNLNATVLLGFESVNDIYRNVLYDKNLSLRVFEESTNILKEYNLTVGAFVFIGAHSLTQNEIVKDAEKSIEYLESRNIVPVLMIANLKKCTLDHLLYVYGKHTPVEPRTIYRILKKVRAICSDDALKWLIADPVG